MKTMPKTGIDKHIKNDTEKYYIQRKGVFYLENFKREKIAEGVHFSTIRDERFKTSRMAVAMYTDIEKEKAPAVSTVSGILVHSCEEYPTFRELSRKLDMLYGMSIDGSSGKRGEEQVVLVSASGISDAYSLDGESVYEEMAKLLCSVIFKPNVKDGAFSEEDFKQEQRQALDAIDAQQNDKRAWARKRLLEVMCADEKYGISVLGTKELVEGLTAKSLYETYKELLKTARIEVICLCANDTENVKRIFTEQFSKIERDVKTGKTVVIGKADKTKEATDEMEVVQSKLMMGFRTDCAEPDKNADAVKLMSAVLGGTAHSKLFNNVREKQSLCYYCVSSYDPTKGVLTVESGVEKQNIEKTKNAVLKEIEDMKNGVITDEEIESAKLSIANSYLTSVDTSSGTLGWYLMQIYKGTQLTPQQQAEKIAAVTKEDIVAAANRLTLDTVYVLTSKDDGTEEGE